MKRNHKSSSKQHNIYHAKLFWLLVGFSLILVLSIISITLLIELSHQKNIIQNSIITSVNSNNEIIKTTLDGKKTDKQSTYNISDNEYLESALNYLGDNYSVSIIESSDKQKEVIIINAREIKSSSNQVRGFIDDLPRKHIVLKLNTNTNTIEELYSFENRPSTLLAIDEDTNLLIYQDDNIEYDGSFLYVDYINNTINKVPFKTIDSELIGNSRNNEIIVTSSNDNKTLTLWSIYDVEKPIAIITPNEEGRIFTNGIVTSPDNKTFGILLLLEQNKKPEYQKYAIYDYFGNHLSTISYKFIEGAFDNMTPVFSPDGEYMLVSSWYREEERNFQSDIIYCWDIYNVYTDKRLDKHFCSKNIGQPINWEY